MSSDLTKLLVIEFRKIAKVIVAESLNPMKKVIETFKVSVDHVYRRTSQLVERNNELAKRNVELEIRLLSLENDFMLMRRKVNRLVGEPEGPYALPTILGPSVLGAPASPSDDKDPYEITQLPVLDVMTETAPELTETVHELRSRLGLSREDLAAHLNVSAQSIRNWEIGATQPRASAQHALAKLASLTPLSVDDAASALRTEPGEADSAQQSSEQAGPAEEADPSDDAHQ